MPNAEKKCKVKKTPEGKKGSPKYVALAVLLQMWREVYGKKHLTVEIAVSNPLHSR